VFSSAVTVEVENDVEGASSLRVSLLSAAKKGRVELDALRFSLGPFSLSVAASTELAPALSITTPRSATALRRTSFVRLAPEAVPTEVARLISRFVVARCSNAADDNKGAVSGAADVANVTVFSARVLELVSFSRVRRSSAASSRSRTSAAWRRAASICFFRFFREVN
jgi:hypothetical protein